MARPPIKRPLPPKRGGAGEQAPESAAASSPAGFYSPGDEPAPANPLAAATFEHVARTQAAAQPVGEVTAESPGVVHLEPGDDLEADIARIMAMRRPLGVQAQKLALPKRNGYHTHWFNDEGGRIDDALNNGWAHRKDKDGKPLKRAVGMGRDKGVLYAYAMDIPEIFWLEDMAARNQLAADKMESLKASPFQAKSGQAQKSDAGKFYSPVEGQEPLQVAKR